MKNRTGLFLGIGCIIPLLTVLLIIVYFAYWPETREVDVADCPEPITEKFLVPDVWGIGARWKEVTPYRMRRIAVTLRKYPLKKFYYYYYVAARPENPALLMKIKVHLASANPEARSNTKMLPEVPDERSEVPPWLPAQLIAIRNLNENKELFYVDPKDHSAIYFIERAKEGAWELKD